MQTILMTGVSGFLGSVLAAALLQDGNCRILSLSPDSATVEPARTAVMAALAGLGANPERAQSIEPLIADILDPAALDRCDFTDVDAVWHVAARMSYDFDQFVDTMDFNVNGAARLMAAMPANARFYFISTTGIAGPGDSSGSVVPEALVDIFEPLNPYTVSKQLAEKTLYAIARERGQPLTIVRPGAIIGDSQSGWSNGTRYGYYSYLQAFRRYLGRMPSFAVAIDPDRVFPVIHVDHLARACRALSHRGNADDFEVFHLINGGGFTVATHFSLFEELVDRRIRISFGAGETAANRAFNSLNADNNRFMGTRHRFETGTLARVIGVDAAPPALTRQGVANVIRHYLGAEVAA